MIENRVKTRLGNREPVFGVIAPNHDPIVAEVIGRVGFDFYMLDGEHGSIGPAQAENIVRACEAVGITPLARVRSTDPKLLLQFMDAGIMGVMMPGIETADDVKRLVDAIKYPPMGTRGLGPVRAADYMLGPMPQAKYVSYANEQTLVLPQIEDINAVKHLEEMARVEGIDGFIIGPRDLAMSMGYYDGPGHDEVKTVINNIFEIVLGSGLVLGTTAGTGEEAKALVERGALICLGSVSGLLKSAATTFFRAARG